MRIPSEQARRLDRAALELRLSKQSLVSNLLERYVDPDSRESLAALASRRVTVETLEPDAMPVGHHSFHPRVPEVLTAAETAELLQVQEAVVLELARAHELPGRELAGQWRFSRTGILRWLGRSEADDR